MSDTKKFFELVSSDKSVQSELERASLDALKSLLESKGLAGEAQKVLREAMKNVAEAHGIKGGMEEISPEEMNLVAGGDNNYWYYLYKLLNGASV